MLLFSAKVSMQRFYGRERKALVGFFMNREEATACLKEILNSCINVNPDAFLLMESSPGATGYTIYMKANLDSACKEQVSRIISQHNLSMREENGGIVIFKQKLD